MKPVIYSKEEFASLKKRIFAENLQLNDILEIFDYVKTKYLNENESTYSILNNRLDKYTSEINEYFESQIMRPTISTDFIETAFVEKEFINIDLMKLIFLREYGMPKKGLMRILQEVKYYFRDIKLKDALSIALETSEKYKKYDNLKTGKYKKLFDQIYSTDMRSVGVSIHASEKDSIKIEPQEEHDYFFEAIQTSSEYIKAIVREAVFDYNIINMPKS